MTRPLSALGAAVCLVAVSGCRTSPLAAAPRASGYVEATEIRVASKVPGRVDRVNVVEGARVAEGDVLVAIATTEIDLALNRSRAERDQADAQVRLLRAGPRVEDVRQAEAQVATAVADQQTADADLAAAKTDQVRFQQLVDNRAGATKQRDDAVARRELAEARVKAAAERVATAQAALTRVRAGARPEEMQAAEARVRIIDADIATINQRRTDTTITAPAAAVVTSRLVEPGELVAVGVPLAVLVDLDHAWVNAYVEAPLVPSLRLTQSVTIVTDAGQRIAGQLAFIAPRAEFTPRNVQTSTERAKLVYRVKVTVDNHEGVLKPGMPVEVLLGPEGAQ